MTGVSRGVLSAVFYKNENRVSPYVVRVEGVFSCTFCPRVTSAGAALLSLVASTKIEGGFLKPPSVDVRSFCFASLPEQVPQLLCGLSLRRRMRACQGFCGKLHSPRRPSRQIYTAHVAQVLGVPRSTWTKPCLWYITAVGIPAAKHSLCKRLRSQ